MCVSQKIKKPKKIQHSTHTRTQTHTYFLKIDKRENPKQKRKPCDKQNKRKEKLQETKTPHPTFWSSTVYIYHAATTARISKREIWHKQTNKNFYRTRCNFGKHWYVVLHTFKFWYFSHDMVVVVLGFYFDWYTKKKKKQYQMKRIEFWSTTYNNIK